MRSIRISIILLAMVTGSVIGQTPDAAKPEGTKPEGAKPETGTQSALMKALDTAVLKLEEARNKLPKELAEAQQKIDAALQPAQLEVAKAMAQLHSLAGRQFPGMSSGPGGATPTAQPKKLTSAKDAEELFAKLPSGWKKLESKLEDKTYYIILQREDMKSFNKGSSLSKEHFICVIAGEDPAANLKKAQELSARFRASAPAPTGYRFGIRSGNAMILAQGWVDDGWDADVQLFARGEVHTSANDIMQYMTQPTQPTQPNPGPGSAAKEPQPRITP